MSEAKQDVVVAKVTCSEARPDLEGLRGDGHIWSPWKCDDIDPGRRPGDWFWAPSSYNISIRCRVCGLVRSATVV
jgi:hypothetical protein